MRRQTSVLVVALMLAIAAGGCSRTDPDADGQPSQQPSATVSSPTPSESPSSTVNEYTSPKGVVIKLDDFPSGKTVSSPVTITGEVPGSWSFEADFPIMLVDWDGKIIAQGPAQLQGDWMTDELVPFTATLTFTTPAYKNTGALILRKDNPSGLAKHDDALEIPVVFE